MMFKQLSFLSGIAFVLWGLVVVLATFKALMYPETRSVFNHYFGSGFAWIHGEDLYNGGRGFIYFPTFACLMAPLSLLGFHIASGLWEIVQVSIFVSGLYAVANHFRPRENGKNFFFWITLATLPIAFSSIRNTQANILMLGITLWSTVVLAKARWNIGSVLLVLGLAIKPTFIVFFLLSAATFRALWGRVIIAFLVVFFLPFLLQTPDYVMNQYLGFIHMLEQAVGVGEHEPGWANFLNVLPQLTGYFIPHEIQTIVRLIAALVVLITCCQVSKKSTTAEKVLLVFMLSMAYLLVFNPRSENTDYVFIGCIYGFGLGTAIGQHKNLPMVVMCLFILGTLFASTLSKLLSPWESWVNPSLALIFLVWLIIQCWRRPLHEIFILNFVQQTHNVSKKVKINHIS